MIAGIIFANNNSTKVEITCNTKMTLWCVRYASRVTVSTTFDLKHVPKRNCWPLESGGEVVSVPFLHFIFFHLLTLLWITDT